MSVLNITVTTLAVIVLSACSSTSNTEGIESKVFDYKAPPAKVRALEVPPDLTSYAGDDRYAITGEGEGVTRYSEFAKGGTRKTTGVLPPLRNVHLEHKDTRRWLVVEDKAENIWPVIKAFWQENGLTIKDENPQAGIMETEWAENRAKIPMDAFRKYMGKVFDGMLSSSEKDQYHTRLERSKDGNSTEIYIVHYGMQEVAEKDETGYRWLPRPSDPELEATMLQLLMSKLGGGSGVLNNDKKTSAVPEESASAPKLNKQADGSQSVLLSETFDKSWRKVGLALDQAKIALADKDRSKGVYYLSSGKDDAKGKQGTGKISGIQVKVIEKATGCEVVVNNAAGESNADTQKILDILFKTLGRL
jgi:outer membrane protein assembly factor BamC